MTTKESLEIKKAILTLADFTGIEPGTVVGNICFLDENNFKKFKEASNLWNEFEDADIVTRGKMLGIEVQVV